MDKQKDRAEFFKSVEQNMEDYPLILTSLFDQFSLLYNLVGNYKSVKVANESTHSKVQFIVDFEGSSLFIFSLYTNSSVSRIL